MNIKNHPKERLLSHFPETDTALISKALILCEPLNQINSIRPRGIEVALILLDFDVNRDTLLAALLSDPLLSLNDSEPTITEQFGETVAGLVKDVNWLNTLKVYAEEMSTQPSQTETLRRMLLSMTQDARAVLIKLAYRIQRLRNIQTEEQQLRHFICQETLDIYAPIANRLGISQMKWELEDLSLRYLEPDAYQYIATSLAENRNQREQCIDQFMTECRESLQQQDIAAELAGRPKHIYSIWKKMQRKQLDIDELYDLLAIRITVDQITTCYAVLGAVHGRWQYVPKEFDDYIANPKENGYQSLHTVILDAQGNRIEIQIRTQQMHELAEFGVAAHWRYKEGGRSNAATEQCIASLRQLLTDKDNSDQAIDSFKTELFEDRVFVLSPAGKLIDLVKDSTPLDFAYAIHTEVGHRCRGAKVNGRIVPLSYRLQSGERVEVLTVKKGDPNRNWIDPNLGYLKSPRSIGKVKSWFKHQEYEDNIQAGKTILDKERERLNIESINMDKLIKNLHQDNPEKLLAAIGRGDINYSRLSAALKPPATTHRTRKHHPKNQNQKSVVLIEGLGNVMTSMAHCCEPSLGDGIIGFISHTRGITIHHQDCGSIKHLTPQQQTQLISASWG